MKDLCGILTTSPTEVRLFPVRGGDRRAVERPGSSDTPLAWDAWGWGQTTASESDNHEQFT